MIWWLTFTARDRHCDECGEASNGMPVYYQHGTQTTYCLVCGENLGLAALAFESKRYRRG
jgi:hypothetical protein